MIATAALTVFASAESPYVHKSPRDRFGLMVNATQKEDWKTVVYQGYFLTERYPHSPLVPESHYYLARGLQQKKQYAKANSHYSSYLKMDMAPRFFEETIAAKFTIAKELEKSYPETAIEIYSEITGALPRSEVAAECLFRKGELLRQTYSFKEAIDAYQNTIRRFPKSHYAPESYIGIAESYYRQVKQDFPDPDLLNLAKINMEEFALAFPSEPRIQKVHDVYVKMRDQFAKELYEVARFYQKTDKPAAAKIYYDTLIEQYPDSTYAKKSTKQMAKLAKVLPA